MPRKAESTFVFLLEHEVREAAQALKALFDLPAGSELFGAFAEDALNVCNAALLGAHDETVSLILTRASEILRLEADK